MKLYTFLVIFQADLRSIRTGAWEESTLLKSDLKNQCFWCCFSSFLVVEKLICWSFFSVARFSPKVGAREGHKGARDIHHRCGIG